LLIDQNEVLTTSKMACDLITINQEKAVA